MDKIYYTEDVEFPDKKLAPRSGLKPAPGD